jgi:hypothetical protein
VLASSWTAESAVPTSCLYLEEAELFAGQQPRTPEVGQLLVLLDRIDDQRRNAALELAAAKPAL